jgi:hypothetical protein
MAVKTWAYQKQSGMNKRKAGEDFYFLQKIIQLGDFMEINTTRVIPSPRTSDRVPFGTGRSMLEYLDGNKLDKTYNFQSFLDVKLFLDLFMAEYEGAKLFGDVFMRKLPTSIQAFLVQSNFEERIKDLLEYGTNKVTFSKRFFNWFTAFRVLKFVHFCRDEYYPNSSLLGESQMLLKEIGVSNKNPESHLDMLELYRKLESGL